MPLRVPKRRLDAGFTLVELLVYVTVASVVLAAAAATVLSSISSSSNLELERRGLETWSRITQFIEGEVAEAAEISFDRGFERCLDTLNIERSATAKEVQFSMAFPVPPDTIWQSTNLSVFDRNNQRIWVYYTLRRDPDTNELALVRCGPPYDANGELRADAPNAYESMIHPRVEMSRDSTKSNTHRITYTLNLFTPSTSSGGRQGIFRQAKRATATTGQQLID
jgi:prepilin-type N-terminal cleavage/methylation domain-containing protein